MSLHNFAYSAKTFVSQDSKETGEFQIFGTLSAHMKLIIMEGMTPVTLINLVEADPTLAVLAESVMKRTELHRLYLMNLPSEYALDVVLEWEKSTDSVKFFNESRDRSGELEMYRKAYTFILRICDATKTTNASFYFDAETEPFPDNLPLLGLPSLGRVITVAHMHVPVYAPIDFFTQINTRTVDYIVPYRPDIDAEQEFARLVELYVSSPRV